METPLKVVKNSKNSITEVKIPSFYEDKPVVIKNNSEANKEMIPIVRRVELTYEWFLDYFTREGIEEDLAMKLANRHYERYLAQKDTVK